MKATTKVEYLNDRRVNAVQDRMLRDLLTTCFKKPEDRVFWERRYFKEPPQHRWIIRNRSGRIIAHVAVHEKHVLFRQRPIKIGGVAEVCVHPRYRGRGFVRSMLQEAHDWLRTRGFPFAVLLGSPEVYTSSGYAPAKNLYHEWKRGTPKKNRKKIPYAMVKILSGESWPSGEVVLKGMTF